MSINSAHRYLDTAGSVKGALAESIESLYDAKKEPNSTLQAYITQCRIV